MFPFITDTVNPIAGGPCPYGCSYCWATVLKNKHQWEKYQGEYRLIEKELKHYGNPSDFVFIQDMGDIGDPKIPESIINRIIRWTGESQASFLMLTKNPEFYTTYWRGIPFNVMLGATIETDLKVDCSKAPTPMIRLKDMAKLADWFEGQRRFVSIEPIMKFSPNFADYIIDIEPWAVAIGYDNYNNNLHEPSFAETRELIKNLRNKGIYVFEKTIREASQLHLKNEVNQK
jgi:DNA repair photolyase